MRYGIKVKSHNTYNWLMFFNETKGYPSGPMNFTDRSDAEVYAQDHELNDYIIEVINDSDTSGQKQLLT